MAFTRFHDDPARITKQLQQQKERAGATKQVKIFYNILIIEEVVFTIFINIFYNILIKFIN